MGQALSIFAVQNKYGSDNRKRKNYDKKAVFVELKPV